VTNSQGYYSFTVPAGTYTVTYGSVPSRATGASCRVGRLVGAARAAARAATSRAATLTRATRTTRR
jgi:hypothetical protein